MRISDWSSDVCSSDLGLGCRFALALGGRSLVRLAGRSAPATKQQLVLFAQMGRGTWKTALQHPGDQIGRASCMERVCQYVQISVVAVALKKKTKITS